MSLPIYPSQSGGYPKFKFKSIKCNSTGNRHAVSSRAEKETEKHFVLISSQAG